jgi:DNA-binding transcriptional LysR family regulator
MSLTLEEARTLVVFSKQGTISKTASLLKKSNSAIVYTLDSIESKTELPIFNRTAYRTTLSTEGFRILEGCKKMLEASRDLNNLCHVLANGWESDLKLIIEGVVPLEPILKTIKSISKKEIPTRFHVLAEFLGSVENSFLENEADLMISVLTPTKVPLESIALEEVPAFLVAHCDHSLVQGDQKNSVKQMSEFPILTVRGSSPQLSMSTSQIESLSTIQLNDFNSKKLAIMNGLGYGWMPEYLIENELRSGQIKLIRWHKTNKHVFRPHLYYKSKKKLGNAGKLFIEQLGKNANI